MKKAIRWGFLAIAGGLVVWAIVTQWDEVSAALAELSWGAIAGSFALSLAALFASLMSWRAVMRAVGLETGLVEATRVFGLSQIGKYIPGSVWPVLAQAEFARDHGVSRARAMTGSLVAMAVGAVTAGVVGAVGLVIAQPGAVLEYWWVLLVAALLAAVLIPDVLTFFVGIAFRVTKRKDEPVRIGARSLAVSAAWNVGQWALLGVHAWVLLREIAPGAGLVLTTGAFALAWLVGFVVVIAPAGAGAREVALVFLLTPVATPAQALSLALVSRFLMTGADVVGFLVALAIGARRPKAAARDVDAQE